MRLGEANRGHRTAAPGRPSRMGARLMLWLGLIPALAAVVATGSPVPGPAAASGIPPDTLGTTSVPPRILSLHADLLSKLQLLADGLHTEIVLCLFGEVRGDTAHAVRFTMPVPRRSDSLGARFAPCPSAALAVWHNHPVPPAGFHAPRPVTGAEPAELCRLSSADVRTAARAGHAFTVVSVDASTLCWWTLADVRTLERAPLP